MNIGIIGGGASGMILASKLKKNNVTLIEKNNKLGKKLLLTGNGKCNYTNLNFNNLDIIYNNDFAIELFKIYNNYSFIDYFNKIGIVAKVETHKGIDYIYPNSNKSTSVYYCLLDKIHSNGVNILYNSEVLDIGVDRNKFYVTLDNKKTLVFDKLVLATGGMSYKNTGSDGLGYKLAKKLGHNIIDLLPGLSSLKFTIDKDDRYKFNGKCRVNAKVVYKSKFNDYTYDEIGEIQFNDDTISGIPILNLSNKIAKDLKKSLPIKILIDFSDSLLTDITNKNKNIKNDDLKIRAIKEVLINRRENTNYRKTNDFLCGYLPDEISEVLLKVSGINNKDLSYLKDSECEILAKNIVAFKIYVNELPNFDNAQITIGGVDINQIEVNTLESKIIKGLYFTGEILDIDGICGGYNLQLAYSTASVVADSL